VKYGIQAKVVYRGTGLIPVVFYFQVMDEKPTLADLKKVNDELQWEYSGLPIAEHFVVEEALPGMADYYAKSDPSKSVFRSLAPKYEENWKDCISPPHLY
jgi:hypothetical protein